MTDMIKIYFKQTWRLLKENPVLSTISILGTALAICMIMVMVMAHEVKNAPYAPEVNRDRMLYVKTMTALHKEDPKESNSANAALSYTLAKECFKPLKTPEAVSIVSFFYDSYAMTTQVGSDDLQRFDKMLVDEVFWDIFDFSFIDGKPFTQADVEAGLPRAVISETVARKVFGTTAVTGKTIVINLTEHLVSGVVRDVTPLATAAYAQIWTPIHKGVLPSDFISNISGVCSVLILAKSSKDFDKIREEAETLRVKHNDAQPEYMAYYREQPDNHFTFLQRVAANVTPDVTSVKRQYAILIALLLIVPAINLSGMTTSRMRKRLSELGVRRAFGAKRSDLLSQVLWESLVQTLLGGLIGIFLSFVASYAFADIIYGGREMASKMGGISISPFALLSPMVFVYAILFCLVLNLLSALYPAWRTSRQPIVQSLLSK